MCVAVHESFAFQEASLTLWSVSHLQLTVGECSQSGKLLKEKSHIFLPACPVFLSCLPSASSFIHLTTLVLTWWCMSRGLLRLCFITYVLIPCNHCTQWLYLDVQKVQREIASCKRILGLVELGAKGSGISSSICLLCIFFIEILNNICMSLFQGEPVLFNASKAVW